MARGSEPANTAATTAQTRSDTYAGNAGNLFSTIAPILATEAAHPSGMSPTDIAASDTAAQETAGGTQGAAVGQGLLRAARTRNAGGSDAALAASADSAGHALSTAGITTRLKNASMKREQQSEGIKGLGGLFAENLAGGNAALGQVAPNVNASVNQENASWNWAKELFQPILAAASNSKYVTGGG